MFQSHEKLGEFDILVLPPSNGDYAKVKDITRSKKVS